MFQLFDGTAADDVWLQMAAAFRDDSLPKQRSRAGPTREILRVAMSIRNPRRRWIISRRPALNPAFALAEVIWIMAGRNDSAFVNQFNPMLPKFAGRGATYHGAYGHRLRAHVGVDQLTRACDVLANNPDSRQVVLQVWDSRADLPDERGRPVSEDVPCNVLAMLKVRDGRLEWTQVVRSNDLMLGVPHNIVQFTCMQEILAGWIGVQLGSFNVLSDSLHVYERDLDSVRAAMPLHLPEFEESLALPRAESERALARIVETVDQLRDETASPPLVDTLIRAARLPSAFENILRVLAADGERRRSRGAHGTAIMSKSTNPAYIELWRRWELRCADREHRGRAAKVE
jgi:thymidylate synthase